MSDEQPKIDGSLPAPIDYFEGGEALAKRKAEASMPRGAELRKLPPSLPPAEWWEEDNLF